MNVSTIECTGTTADATATLPARPDVVLMMADQLVPMLVTPLQRSDRVYA